MQVPEELIPVIKAVAETHGIEDQEALKILVWYGFFKLKELIVSYQGVM